MRGEPRLGELALLGKGREAEVFAWGDGRALRLAYGPALRPNVEREALALAAAHRAGAPVPEMYERITVADRPGVVMERVDGEDLLTRLGRRPWLVAAVGRTLGRTHAQLHAVAAPSELPRLRAETRRRLESELVPADVRGAALSLLDALPDGDRLCHGDFHPANLLHGRDGCLVIDWTHGTSGDATADVALTRLILTGGEVPPDGPPLIRRLDRVGRGLLLAAYMRAYRRIRPLDGKRIETWERVCAAVRLSDGISAERARMLGIARGGG